MKVFAGALALFFYCLVSGEAEENVTETGENNSTQETFILELFPSQSKYSGQTRTPRKFFQKLHSGAAFLTGLKLGSVLSKKGFELGHGKIASTHSFQIFGKSVNSAMSLSYGDRPGQLLPVLDEPTNPEGNKRTDLKEVEKDDRVFHVTVIETPVEEADKDGNKTEKVLVLYQDLEEKPTSEDNFIEDHNKRVREFNEEVQKRTNSKF